jgi:hypothetical protein
VPVHLLGYFPAHRMSAVPFGQAARLTSLRALLMEVVGLHHVYVPLSLGADETATSCRSCGFRVVDRPLGRRPVVRMGQGGRCPGCGGVLAIHLGEVDEIRDGRLAASG